MGGQLNYFGFWLDDDFGSGHSRGQPSCTTYGNPPLSAQEEFKIDKLEAWGVGVPPENEVRPDHGATLEHVLGGAPQGSQNELFYWQTKQ